MTRFIYHLYILTCNILSILLALYIIQVCCTFVFVFNSLLSTSVWILTASPCSVLVTCDDKKEEEEEERESSMSVYQSGDGAGRSGSSGQTE